MSDTTKKVIECPECNSDWINVRLETRSELAVETVDVESFDHGAEEITEVHSVPSTGFEETTLVGWRCTECGAEFDSPNTQPLEGTGE